MFLLILSFGYEKYAKVVCRAARAHMPGMEKRVEVARGEVSKIKLRQLFNCLLYTSPSPRD